MKTKMQSASGDGIGALDPRSHRTNSRRTQAASRAAKDAGWNLEFKDGVVLTLLGSIMVTGVSLIWISLS